MVAVRIYGQTLRQFGWAIVTVLLVFGVSYVMNLSGQISTLGIWLAQTGPFFAFLAPVVGWFGVAVTGTDAGSNALFGNLQVTAARSCTPTDPVRQRRLLRRRHGKNDLPAEPGDRDSRRPPSCMEGVLFRKVFGWSVLFLLAVCVLAYLQSTPCWLDARRRLSCTADPTHSGLRASAIAIWVRDRSPARGCRHECRPGSS